MGDPPDETVVPVAIRVMVVEDRPFLIDRLRAVSGEYSDIEVVGGSTAGGAALTMAAQLDPNVVLIEERLSDTDGFDLCDRIHRESPEAALIFVSEMQTDAARLSAVEAGACGFISRFVPDGDLVLAVLRAAEGEFLFPAAVTLRLFRRERELRMRRSHNDGQGDTSA